jgi:hypothetical protein
MHTVDLLQEALRVAEKMGYAVREEWLGGMGGGGCEIRGRKWLFLNLRLGPLEQLDHVVDALQRDPAVFSVPMPDQLRGLLRVRKVA